MMKNVKFILYVFIAFFSLFGARDADAFLIKKLLAKAGIPTFKITTLPVNIMNSTVVVSTVSTTKSALETIKMVKDLGGVNFENVDEVSSKMSNLGVTQDGVRKLNKSTKKLLKTKVADIYSEESVSSAVYKLFLVEPSESGAVINCYRQQRENFYKDTSAEIFASIREIDKTVPAIIEELAATENLMKNGGGAVGDLSSNTVALDVSYQASEVLDKIARMTEELTALQAQFEMVSAMRDTIQPLTKREAEELKDLQKGKKSSSKKTSSFWDGNKYVSRSELAFAQLQEDEEDEFDVNDFVTYDTKDAPTPNIKGAFEGHETSLEAVKNLAELKDELTDALTMHNVSTTLLSYKDIFEEYEKMKQLHAKSLEMLSKSDQCVINYLGKYYDNPEQVWSGGYLGALVNQTDMRKGVSKWLIDSYDVAKSQMVTDVAVENSASTTIDSSIDIQNLENAKKGAEKHMNSQKLETSFSESELKKYEGSGRDVQILPWKIGADVSRSVALDQYADNKWGKVKTPFPLWNDQKKFYDLYLEAKYNNIIDYFNYADLRDVELGIARGINKENGEEADAEYKKQANQKNSKWYSNLESATSKAKFKALDDDADWYVGVKNKILGMEANQKDLAERKARLKKQTQTKAVISELADITANERWLSGYKTKMTDVATGEELGKALSTEIEKARTKEETAETKTDDVFGLYDEEILKIMSEKKKELFVINSILKQKNEQLVAVKKTISDSNKMINNEEEAKLEAKENGTSYESNINTQSLNQIISEQKKIREKLEAEIKENVAKAGDVERQYDTKLAEKEQELQKKLNLISDAYKQENKYASVTEILNQGLKSSLAKKASAASTMTANLAKANALLIQVRSYAADIVLRTRNNIFGLENDLYFPKSNTLVVKEHSKMIDELKSISFEKFSSFAAGANVSNSLLSIASEAINQHLMSKVCPDDSCFVADDDYFVGIVSKSRDFKAPKEPFLEYLPPVREAFYFDGTSFASLYNEKNYVDVKIPCEEMRASGDIVSDVKVVIEYKADPARPRLGLKPIEMCKFKRYYVSKTQFLDSEIYLPQVWRRVLTGRSFVERDINLKDFLNQEAKQSVAANVDFLRGGRYPCLLSGVTIDVSEDAKYIISTDKFENLPTCQNVSLERKAYYFNIKDLEEDVTTSIGNGASKPRFEGSELGFIFSSSDDGYLFIKNTVKSIFEKLQEIDKQQEEGKEYNPNMQDLIYANSILNVSQFGDFLSSAEQEQNYLKSVEELKISVDEAKEALFSTLKQAGFEPQEDLNLANEDDFNLVKKTLHNKKIQIINDVKRKSRSYNELLNEVVTERIEEINDLSNALLQDNEEMISLSMSLPTSAELAEQIKSEKVNIKVREEHKKQAQDAFQKELNRMIRPYCASY